jgi:hypothetical protein
MLKWGPKAAEDHGAPTEREVAELGSERDGLEVKNTRKSLGRNSGPENESDKEKV